VGDLLTGLALQHDLGLLIERLSDTLDIQTTTLAEPVLSIDDVTERFNVTSKTIQRWRRKGLVARRFIFPDGKRRVGFLLSGVERFLSCHQRQISAGTNFSQVSAGELEEILRRSRRIAERDECDESEVARRVARKVNRSPLTVQHLLKKHDTDHPAAAILTRSPARISDDERGRIVRAFARGMGLNAIARRFNRSRMAVYRVVIDERLNRVMSRKTKFIDDSLYHQPDAASVMADIVSQQPLSGDFDRTASRVPRDLPPYLAELYRTPLLSPLRERALFLKFNFHKWQFVSARRKVEPHRMRSRDLQHLESYMDEAIDVKNAIVRANLRLVVSVARKHLRPGLSLMELVSDGNVTLMRAVESFDVHRGYRFSTYASLALMKGFARSVPLMLGHRAVQPATDQIMAEVPDRRIAETNRLADRDHLRKLLAVLDPHERQVLLAHYGLAEGADGPAGHTLSPRRVKQIHEKALDKIRAAIDISAA
jgi:RNA polymerase sigma factor (sigma-70 family)